MRKRRTTRPASAPEALLSLRSSVYRNRISDRTCLYLSRFDKTLDSRLSCGSASSRAACSQISCAQPWQMPTGPVFHARGPSAYPLFHKQQIDLQHDFAIGCFFARPGSARCKAPCGKRPRAGAQSYPQRVWITKFYLPQQRVGDSLQDSKKQCAATGHLARHRPVCSPREQRAIPVLAVIAPNLPTPSMLKRLFGLVLGQR